MQRKRTRAASFIAAFWRAYCVRANQARRKAAACRVQRWLRFLRIHWETQDAAAEILSRSRVLRDRIQIWRKEAAATKLTAWALARLASIRYQKKRRAALKISSRARTMLACRSV